MASGGKKVEVVTDLLFLGSKITAVVWNRKTTASWQESYDKPRWCIEKQKHYSANKGLFSQGYGLPSGHLQLGELDRKGRAPKNRCLQLWCWRGLLRARDSKGVRAVSVKGNHPDTHWNAQAESLVFWSSDVKSQLVGKVPDAGKKLRAEEGVRGWDSWMALLMQWTRTWANSRRWWGLGGLARCNPWGHKWSDKTGRLNKCLQTVYLWIHLVQLSY